MRRWLAFALVSLVAVSGAAALRVVTGGSREGRVEVLRTSDVRLAADSAVINGVVPARTTLDGLLLDYEVDDADRLAMVAAVQEVFDVRRVRAGQPFSMDRLLDGRIRTFEYEIDGDRRLVARAADEMTDAPADQSDVALASARVFEAVIERIEKVATLAAVEGLIDRELPSLTQALDTAGERLELALQMAEIFAGELDFSSELQPGDHFRLVVERQTRADGEFAGYGPILAAELVTSGTRIDAYRYAPSSGEAGYFDSEGRSLKRFFLKSPLKFEPRVTSRFASARRHPVLDYTRAHNGVDYAAPAGAPVGAVAPGLVTLAGWTGGGGRTVRIRHANGYESEYLHLSAIGVRAGERVAQGELVGRVGSTGLATGPHLHYGLRRNGAYVNPVVEHRNMPPGEPVPAFEIATFSTERDRLFALFAPPRLKAAN